MSDVFPNIVQRKREDEPWRLWVIGCSTGQEAYSLSICLLEFFSGGSRPHVQIFATDVNDKDIAVARMGIYPPTIANEMSESRLRKYFDVVPQGYQVKKSLREMCIFAKHDVTRDPPFTRLDLISCRNVLIYFGSQMQERLIPLFHYALHPSGFLVLGSSESVGRYGGLFELLDKKNRIYARKPGRGELPFEFGQPVAAGILHPSVVGPAHVERAQLPFDIVREADRIAAGAYAPASVVVSEELRILHFRGDTSPFLAHPSGAPSFDLVQMAREGLGAVLRDAVAEAKLYARTVRRSGVTVRTVGGRTSVNLVVIPFRAPDGEIYFLVSFEQKNDLKAEELEPGEKPDENQTLRDELNMTRDHLQTVIRDKEAALEELRAAYEEIQSSNEELQSINEELETAKEELQSINEELTTVNDELQLRNQDLVRAHDDLANLLANIDVPILMLDQDLNIRSYTPATERLLRVIPGDVGRPLADIRLSVHVEDLEGMIRQAIDEVSAQEKEAYDDAGRWYSVHVRPYKTGDMRIGGAVVSFQDVAELRKSLERSREAAKLSEVLSSISGIVTSEEEPKRIIPKVMRAAAGALEAPAAFLATAGEDGWTIEQVLHLPLQLVGKELTFAELPAATQVTREKGRAYSSRVVEHSPLLARAGISHTLAIPFPFGQDEDAVLVLGYRGDKHEITGMTAEFTEKLVLTLTLAMENLRYRQVDKSMAEAMRQEGAPFVTAGDGVDTGYAYSTAQVPERVGGDFLDMLTMGKGIVLVSIGDVEGHGLKTAHLAGVARGGLRLLMQAERSPAHVLKQLNTSLRNDITRGQLVTACVALLDLENRMVSVATAGHYPPVVLSGASPASLDMPANPPLGATADPQYADMRVQLSPGDGLVVFTDGIVEARSEREEFGMERLLSVLREHNSADAQSLADKIMDAALSFAGGALLDDATVGVLRLAP